MFDLISGKVQHVPSTPAIPILVSTGIQGAAMGVIVLSSLLYATHEVPPVPDMMAFMGMPVAAALPPPPPPPAPAAQPQAAPKPAANAFAAPMEAPKEITPEPLGIAATTGDVGVPGGVEGGIAAGVVGLGAAIVEGPPPPPPPPVQHGPVQVGGQIQAPALVKRVEPIYPAIAQFAAIDGIVILDAVVDERGHVQTVKVLRGHPLLAQAGTDAVRQWVYEPLRLNGTATPFELTVTLWFHFDDKAKRHS